MIDSRPARRTRDRDVRLGRAWWLFAASFGALGVVAVLRLALYGRPGDWLVAGLALVAGFAAVWQWRVVRDLETGRRVEAESFARILSGLSRSVSPDAIVEAIVEELGAGTGADHIVVARRRPGGRILEATLVATRPGVPASTTMLPISDLDDPALEAAATRAAVDAVRRGRFGDAALVAVGPGRPGASAAERRDPAPAMTAPHARDDGPERIAARIAYRVRSIYGLKHALAEPLVIDGRVEGAIVVSRRTAEPWPEAARRIVAAAASEASAALSRAYSYREAEARASTDPLTGLPNRRYFDEYVALLARRRRAGDRVGVLMVDIDHFKRVNDTFGHAVGDHVLRAVAAVVARTVREDDVPARFGGEEFAVLLRDPTPEVAVEVAERVRRSVGELDLHGIGVPSVTVSVGVAVAERTDDDIGALIADADAALYRAKRAGRDRVVAASMPVVVAAQGPAPAPVAAAPIPSPDAASRRSHGSAA